MSRIFGKKIFEEKLYFSSASQSLEALPKKSLKCAKEVFDNNQTDSGNIFKVTTRTIGVIGIQKKVDEQAEIEFSRCCCCTTCCTKNSCSASSMENNNV